MGRWPPARGDVSGSPFSVQTAARFCGGAAVKNSAHCAEPRPHAWLELKRRPVKAGKIRSKRGEAPQPQVPRTKHRDVQVVKIRGKPPLNGGESDFRKGIAVKKGGTMVRALQGAATGVRSGSRQLFHRLVPAIGTRSLLVGVHCVVIHPLFVAAGWWELFGLGFAVALWPLLWLFIHFYSTRWPDRPARLSIGRATSGGKK